ncbi:MAG TPA: class I SAM-dependent methyltransferase [Terriglobales bacterium]|nr:class I SAM-dependent methyltransferase [Terriglobales bacterium]
MASAANSFAELKTRLRSTWMAGDFGQIARLNEEEGIRFVDRLGLQPGMKVLDVACGTGNQSIPAAIKGANVTGLDLAPNLLQQARERAKAQQLEIEFVEGDAEELPHEPRSFDVVMSMFGAMFAPRPELVASELLRVCRPGGFICMGNWTPTGFVGKTFAATAKHVPPPPGLPAPLLWGDDEVVRQRLGTRAKVSTTKRILRFDYPYGPSEVVELFRKYFGPTQMTFARLDAQGQEMLRKDLVRLWEEHNQGDADHTVVDAEYLEVRAAVA